MDGVVEAGWNEPVPSPSSTLKLSFQSVSTPRSSSPSRSKSTARMLCGFWKVIGEPGASAKPPAPSPRSTAIFPDATATARSTFWSWSKSADASHDGPLPTTIGETGAGANCPVPSPSRIETVSSNWFATAMILLVVLVEVGDLHAVRRLPDGDRRAGGLREASLAVAEEDREVRRGHVGVPDCRHEERRDRAACRCSGRRSPRTRGRRPSGSAARPAGTRPARCRGGSRGCPSRRWRRRGRASCPGSRPRRRCSTARCRRRRASGSRSRPRRRRGRSRSWCRRCSRRRGRACRPGSDPRRLPSAARRREAASRSPRRRPERPPREAPARSTRAAQQPTASARTRCTKTLACPMPPLSYGHMLLGNGTMTGRHRRR